MKKIDLHLHSDYSEGDLSPQNLIKRVKRENFVVISLTDHNVIDGVSEAIKAGKKSGIVVIPGVEIYTKFKNKNLHLLGYNFDLKNKKLNDLLKQSQAHHLKWAKESLKKMADLGFKIDFDDIDKLKTKYCGFRHLKTIVEKYDVNVKKMIVEIKPQFDQPTLFEFINFYFGSGRPAYVPDINMPIDTKDAIFVIMQAGGIPVLAHPGQQLSWQEDNLIIELKKAGLRGLEAISPYHNWHQTEHYQKLANDLDLIITGGSDYHGDLVDPTLNFQPIKSAWDYFYVPYCLYTNLKKFLK